MAFATLSANLRLNIADFSSNLSKAAGKMNDFAARLGSSYKEANGALKSHNLGLKDTARIVQGIMISQAFYAAVNAIQSATSALWEFNKELDYAQITYSALFGSTQLANDFMSVLQEHAIETIFNYQDLAGISKKLLAYGIDYKNLMFIMEGLTNLGTMSGDPAALDRIALALGQIYTKGKLSAEEMRQLANAYVPITEIITEKFGLTQEQLERVGDLNLPAHEVINAIVDYANEQFGSVGDAAMYTITGLEAKITDTLKTLGVQMIAPISNIYKSFLVYIADGLTNIRDVFEAGGLKGVFEYLVPDKNTQAIIRTFLANIKNLFSSIAALAKATMPAIGAVMQLVMTALNLALPAITGLLNILGLMVNYVSSTSQGLFVLRTALLVAAAAFVIMKVQAAGALIVTAVSKAIAGLSTALIGLATAIAKHPILMLLFALGVALVGISTSSEKAGKSMSGLFDAFAGIGGSSGGDILQGATDNINAADDAIEDFNERLKVGTDSADELEKGVSGVGDAAQKAAKKAAGLLSFDEVFKLNENTGGIGSGGGLGELAGLGDLSGITAGLGNLGELLTPEIPDFTEWAGKFVDGLWGSISDEVKKKIGAVSWGALFGSTITSLLFKNPTVGALGGALVGWLVDEIGYFINNTGSGFFAGIFTTIGKYLVDSGATNGFFTIIVNAFKSGGFSGMWTAIVSIFKGVGLKTLLKGGLVGALAGFLVDIIAHFLWEGVALATDDFNIEGAKIGQTIGGILGSIILGALAAYFSWGIGTGGGMLIGGAAGTFIGGLIGGFFEAAVDLIKKGYEFVAPPLESFFEYVGKVIGRYASGFVDLIGFIWDTIKDFVGWLADTYDRFSGWVGETVGLFAGWVKDTFGGLAEWWDETVAIFSDWDSINSETLANWWNNTKEAFKSWIEDTIAGFTGWQEDNRKRFSAWCKETLRSFVLWALEALNEFVVWVADSLLLFMEWGSDFKDVVKQWYNDTLKPIVDWAVEALNTIIKWCADVLTAIGKFVVGAVLAFVNFGKDVVNVLIGMGIAAVRAIEGWLNDMWTKMSTWFTDTKERVKRSWELLWDPNTWKTGWSHVTGWFGSLIGEITTWFTGKKETIKSLWSGLFNVDNWKSGWDHLKTWFSDLVTDMKNWFTNLGKKVNNWWDDLWDGKNTTVNSSGSGFSLAGHATGGVFNREHIARFAEGNKAEAIIPLENARAMQPFVDAVSNGIVGSLAPIVASVNTSGSNNNLPPMYVGTLIADERGLKELYKRFEVISIQESARRGVPGGAF